MIIPLSELKKRLSPKRFKHTLSCAECAVELAGRHGENTDDARDAALLHDITKDLSCKNQLKICGEHDIILTEIQKRSPALLHALTGAAVAKSEFSANFSVCNAIRWHTTGRADMTELEKIIWIADFIAPGRKNKYVSPVRDAARNDLNFALLIGLDATIGYLLDRHELIDGATIEARNRVLTITKGVERGISDEAVWRKR